MIWIYESFATWSLPMPYPVYKLLHFVGIFAIYLAYGGLIFRAALASDNAGLRKFGGIVSGVGLLLMLVSGFGMMAKMGYSYGSPFFIIKLITWIALGGMIALINRKPELNKVWFILTLVLGIVASWAALFKPFGI